MDPKPSKKMLTLPRFDSISDEWNESGNESWESGWMTVSAHHITTLLIRFRLHVKNSFVRLRLTDPNRPGGGHPVWSTCSPSSLSRTWAPWSSRPSAGLPLGPPGRRASSVWMVNGGGRLIRWNDKNKKYDDLWWWMKRGYEKCIKGEPGVGNPGLWDRHKLLLHLLRGERSRSRLPQPSEGKRGKIHLVSMLLLVLIVKMLER